MLNKIFQWCATLHFCLIWMPQSMPTYRWEHGSGLVLGRTWFGSEVRSVFWGSVGSRFGFWDQNRGSGGSRFGYEVRRTFPNLFKPEKLPNIGRIFSNNMGWKILNDIFIFIFFLKKWTFFSELRNSIWFSNIVAKKIWQKFGSLEIKKATFSRLIKVRGSVF